MDTTSCRLARLLFWPVRVRFAAQNQSQAAQGGGIQPVCLSSSFSSSGASFPRAWLHRAASAVRAALQTADFTLQRLSALDRTA
jgi:hypothetical protein